MMSVAIDTSSIILLAKTDLLTKICSIIKLETTMEVKEEVMRGLKKGKKGALYLRKLIKERKVKVMKANGRMCKRFMKDFNLGLGEASVLALAMRNNLPVITDDNKARKVGKVLNLKVFSSLNFPIILYRNKIIDYEGALLALQVLKKEGWFSKEVMVEAFNELKKVKK
jgi:predicted nucleic acid-binding protein